MQRKFTYIDLFAGCGGLSLGLEKAGFELVLAVEKSDMAAETFYHNFVKRIEGEKEWEDFCSLSPIKQAKKKLVVNEVERLLDDSELQDYLLSQEIDLIAGGPPCQGFSVAGRRNPNDKRNKLPWQFLEVVELIEPKAVIIENVVGMSQNFSKHDKKAPFNQLKQALEDIGPGYKVQQVQLNAMHFGVPQHRPRVLLIALRNDLAEEHRFFEGVWRSEFDQTNVSKNRPDVVPQATHIDNQIKTIKDALWDLDDKGYKYDLDHGSYFKAGGSLAKDLRQDRSWMNKKVSKINGPVCLENHVLRRHTDRVVDRFRLYQVLRDIQVPSRILNVPKKYDELEAKALVQDMLKGVEGPFVSPDKTEIAANKEELIDLIFRFSTKKHSQRPLDWNSPSPTVVSLPDDYVHPSAPRTMTVRELARFQSFPDQFVFRSKETTGSHRRRFEVPQYTQVGNAVPPKMAEAVGRNLYAVLYNSLVAEEPQLKVAVG